ncbi:GTP-binding protein 10, partial [Perkinsus olseni]
MELLSRGSTPTEADRVVVSVVLKPAPERMVEVRYDERERLPMGLYRLLEALLQDTNSLLRSGGFFGTLDRSRCCGASEDPLKEFEVVYNEVMNHDTAWNEQRKWIVCATMCDMLHKDSLFQLDSLYFRLRARFPEVVVMGTSARFGLGIRRLIDEIRTQLYPDALVPSFRERQIPIHRLIAPSTEEVRQITEEFYASGRYSLLEAQAQQDGIKVYLPEDEGLRAALGMLSMDRLGSGEGA